MLKRLGLENIAIVRELDAGLRSGFTVVTGETGSGKSLLLDAIILAFGARVPAGEVLRAGCKRGQVELAFEVPESSPVREFLAGEGVDLFEDETEILISREFTESASRVRINGVPVSRDVASRLRPLVLDLHGQHELTSLFQKETHRRCLDALGDEAFQKLKTHYRQQYRQWQQVRRDLDVLRQDAEDRQKHRDYLVYQLNELEAADLEDENEDLLLQGRLQRLSHAEKLQDLAGQAAFMLGGDDEGALLDGLGRVQRMLSEMAGLDPALAETKTRFESHLEELKSLALEIGNYAETMEGDPQALQQAVERLDLLEKLKRKHGPALAEVIRTRDTLAAGLQEDGLATDKLAGLEAEERRLAEALSRQAADLARQRRLLAEDLSRRLLAELHELALPHARFEVALHPEESLKEWGSETAEFCFSANPGEPLKPLGKVASGGELSRVLLALKVITAEQERVGTLIFDEIDTGISGTVARAVAERLRRLSQTAQVIAVTHQPLVAAFGEQHLHVEKSVTEENPGGESRVEVVLRDLSSDRDQRMVILSRLASGLDSEGAPDEAVEQFVSRLLDQAS